MFDYICDVVIIGVGIVGFVVECSVCCNGVKMLLIDVSFGGIICVSVGCMLFKLLIVVVGVVYVVCQVYIFGVIVELMIDSVVVMNWVCWECDKFVVGVEVLIVKLLVGVKLMVCVCFIGLIMLVFDFGDIVWVKVVVIVMGFYFNIFYVYDVVCDWVLINEMIFELLVFFRLVGVIGVGLIGFEFVQVLVWLGVEMMVFDQGDMVVVLKDEKVVVVLFEILFEEMLIILSVDFKVEFVEDGVILLWSGCLLGLWWFDYLLVVIGWFFWLDGLGFEMIGIVFDDYGMLVFDLVMM